MYVWEALGNACKTKTSHSYIVFFLWIPKSTYSSIFLPQGVEPYGNIFLCCARIYLVILGYQDVITIALSCSSSYSFECVSHSAGNASYNLRNSRVNSCSCSLSVSNLIRSLWDFKVFIYCDCGVRASLFLTEFLQKDTAENLWVKRRKKRVPAHDALTFK